MLHKTISLERQGGIREPGAKRRILLCSAVSGRMMAKKRVLNNNDAGKNGPSFLVKHSINRSDFLDAIYDAMFDGLVVTDASGKIISLNEAAKGIFSYPDDEALGLRIIVLIGDEGQQYFDSQRNNFLKNKGKDAATAKPKGIKGSDKFGKTIELEIMVKGGVVEDDRIFIASLRDVTERNRVLRESYEDLEQFAYVASHDLRAPLRAIDNLSQWIEEDLDGRLEGETKKNMELLRNRVRRLDHLLDDMLHYSRAGRIVGEMIEVDLNDFIRKIGQILNIPEDFTISVKGDLPTVLAPKGVMEQIFGNLINNAIKHHDGKAGTITVSSRNIGYAWEISVADDGPGIAPEYSEKIFKMFQKLEAKDAAEGSGIGLAVVRKLIAAQQGEIWLHPCEGNRGSDFHFTWLKKQAKN